MCNFVVDCREGTDERPSLCKDYKERCDFATDFCQWRQMAGSGDTDWVLGHVGDVVGDIGPAVDHTTGSTVGGFIYANLTCESMRFSSYFGGIGE